MKTTVLALIAATTLGASAIPASAQTIDLGRGGPQIDLRSDRQRERDFRREQSARDQYRAQRYDRDNLSTGSVGNCRTVTVQERDDYGRMVTRQSQSCR